MNWVNLKLGIYLRGSLPLALGVLLLGWGCEKEEPPPPPLSSTEALAKGWERFEQGYYSDAYQLFDQAVQADSRLSDGYNGLGWSAAQLPDKLLEAGEHFSQAIRLNPLLYDALGGWTFVLYQRGSYQTAIEKGDTLLAQKPLWRFLHNPRIDHLDIRLLQAFSWVQLGNFEEAYRVVRSFLNAEFETDITTPTGRRELLDELERLRQIYG